MAVRRPTYEQLRRALADLVEACHWPPDGTATRREVEALARAEDLLRDEAQHHGIQDE